MQAVSNGTVVVEGARNEGATWYYPGTKDTARNVEGRVAFWRGVEDR